MATATQAYDIIRQAFQNVHGRQPTEKGVQLAAGVGRHETGFGEYKPFPGTHNWGAVQCGSIQDKQGNCPPGCHPAFDTSPKDDGTSVKYGACFKVYPDDIAGATDLIKNLTTGARKAALPYLDAGDIWGVAEAMYRGKYYEGFGKTPYDRVASYAKAIHNNAKEVAAKNGVEYLLTYEIPERESWLAAWNAGAPQGGAGAGGAGGAPGVAGVLQPGTGVFTPESGGGGWFWALLVALGLAGAAAAGRRK